MAAIGLHMASWHSEPGYTGFNPGLYIRTECGITAGALRNSKGRFSAYGAFSLDPKKLPVWGTVGLISGYGDSGVRIGTLKPVVMVGLKSPEFDKFRVRVGYAPKAGDTNRAHMIHLMVERAF